MESKALFVKGAALIAMVMASALDVEATPQVRIDLGGTYGVGGGTVVSGDFQYSIGGEFKITPNSEATDIKGYISNYSPLAAYFSSPGVGVSYETFCIEYDEHFSPGSWYTYATSPDAYLGGAGGPSPDPVSQGTAWLYQRFATGVLTGYDYTASAGVREADAGALQRAIWYLEQEIGSIEGGNVFLSAAITQFGSLANAKLDQAVNASGQTQFGVMALNTGPNPSTGAQVQDQLIFVGGGFQTPDGGTTLMLFGVALAGLASVQRRLGMKS